MEQASISSSPILITGATGFPGGFLAGELIQKGRRTILIVRPKGSDTARERVEKLLKFLDIEPKHEPHAADTSFAKRRKPQVEVTNLQGLRNVFDALPNCEKFFHMSSAYSAGTQEGLIKEEIQHPQDFHNPCEQSKNEAEMLITELCKEKSRPYHFSPIHYLWECSHREKPAV